MRSGMASIDISVLVGFAILILIAFASFGRGWRPPR
jgi:hypothetical protein